MLGSPGARRLFLAQFLREEEAGHIVTAKPAEHQKKLTILEDGLAKQSEYQQGKFQLESLLVPLTSNSPAIQASVV